MRAAVYHGRRDVRIDDVPDPTTGRAGSLVLRVRRAAICGTDASEWSHGPHVTANTPLVIGHEFVGEVVAVGAGVTGFAIGERVVSGAGVACGGCAWCRGGRTNLCASYLTLGQQLPGGLAEFVETPATICRRVPDACSDDAAALAQPLSVALHAARRSDIGRGDTVAVIGVGGIGAFVVAAVRAHGAGRVLAFDVNDRRLAQAAGLGADELVNVSGGDLRTAIVDATGGDGAPVVIEASGAPGAAAAAVAATARGGRAVMVGLPAQPVALDVTSMVVREVDLLTSAAHVCDVDLPQALDLLAERDFVGPLVERVIGLDDLVERGILAMTDGSANGKILVDPALLATSPGGHARR